MMSMREAKLNNGHLRLEIAFDFQRWDTLELAPDTGSERMLSGTQEERIDARTSTAGAHV
jgi:hypothetical protein